MRAWVGRGFGFLLVTAYLPGVYEAPFAGRQVAAALGLAILLWIATEREHRAGYGTLFVGFAAFSLLWSPFPYDAANELWKILLLAVAFVVGERGAAPAVFEGAAWGLSVTSVIAIGQSFGWQPVEEASSPAGLFGNRDYLAEAALPVAIWALWRKPWVLIAVLPSLLLPQTRVAIVVFGVLASFRWRNRIATAGTLAVIAAACLAYGIERPLNLEISLHDRLGIWQDTWQGLTWLGRGVGQFYATYPEHATHLNVLYRRPLNAHNEYLELLYDCGPVGLGLAVAFIVATLRVGSGWAFYAFLAVCLDGITAFPFHNPVSGIFALLAAGALWHSRDPGLVRQPARSVHAHRRSQWATAGRHGSNRSVAV